MTRDWRLGSNTALADWLEFVTFTGNPALLSTSERTYTVRLTPNNRAPMAKPRLITRVATLLRDAQEITVGHSNIIETSPHLAPGLYRVIPVEEADSYVKALDRSDARETRNDPSLRARKKKAARRKVAR